MICRSQAEAARDRVRILRPTRESSLLYGDTRKILNFPHLEVVDLTLLDADFALSVLSEVLEIARSAKNRVPLARL